MEGRFQGKIILFILFCSFLSCNLRGNRQNKEPYLLSKGDKALFEEGDIILRMGTGFLSQMICRTLNDSIEISHCGILVKDEHGSFDVIHVLSKEVSPYDGVQRCSLDSFVLDSKKGSIHVVRMEPHIAHLLREKAIYYLHQKIPFDHTFSLQDSTTFFCSELPLHILRYHAGIDLCPKTFHYPKFSLFYDPRYFKQCF